MNILLTNSDLTACSTSGFFLGGAAAAEAAATHRKSRTFSIRDMCSPHAPAVSDPATGGAARPATAPARMENAAADAIAMRHVA